MIRRFVVDGDSWVWALQLRQVMHAAGVEATHGDLAAMVAKEFPSAEYRRGVNRRCGWTGLAWTVAGAEALRWEQILSGDGMPAEIRSREIATDPAQLERMVDAARQDNRLLDGAAYTSAAEQHLREFPWPNAHTRRTWELHVKGTPRAVIAHRMRMRPRSVDRFLDRHRRHCGLLRESRDGRRYAGPEHDAAKAYLDTNHWSSDTERYVWYMAALQRWKFKPIAAELGVSADYVERIVYRHRRRAGLAS